MNSRGGLNGRTHGGHACAMSGDARHMAAARPPSVAVHDDGDVFWEPSRI
jgi:hypothetical protein